MGCVGSKPASPTPPANQPNIRNGAQAPSSAGPPTRAKLVLLGDSGVGKSCIVLRYVRGTFDPSSKITVGAAFLAHNVSLPDGKSLKFEIWDTAGQERYLSLAPLYYRGAHAAAIVFDITSQDTYDKARYWIKELQKNTAGTAVLVLVGNKTDLADQREVASEEARAFADANQMMYIETSAKTSANISEVFESIATKLVATLPVSSSAAGQ